MHYTTIFFQFQQFISINFAFPFHEEYFVFYADHSLVFVVKKLSKFFSCSELKHLKKKSLFSVVSFIFLAVV